VKHAPVAERFQEAASPGGVGGATGLEPRQGDVEKTLIAIAGEHGHIDERAAKAFIADLKKSGRYQADVY